MSNAELDRAIRELKEKVSKLLVERDARNNVANLSEIAHRSAQLKGDDGESELPNRAAG